MSSLPKYMIKRMLFMLFVMFPVLMYAEYIGSNSVIVAGITGGVTSGVSVILFPQPKQDEQNSKEDS